MCVKVVVYRHICDPYLYEPPISPAEYGPWLAAWNDLTLYEGSLGEHYAVGIFWSAIGRKLCLPLVSAFYSSGLRLNQTAQLDALDGELDQLESHWNATDLQPPASLGLCPATLRTYLHERLSDLRHAIRLARESGGVLTVA